MDNRVTQSTAGRVTAIALAAALMASVFGIIGPAPAQASTTDRLIDAQQFLYELNLARSNPAAFVARSGSEMDPNTPPAPPLALNASLTSSALFKSAEMAQYGYFGHQSEATGVWPNALARTAGYALPSAWSSTSNNIESIYRGTSDPFRPLVAFSNSPGHRTHLFGEGWFGSHREIGVGTVLSEQRGTYVTVHTAVVATSDVFVTGVVYHDANGNGRMDRGEGLGGVTVTAGSKSTTTNAGGGYAIKVTAGTHTVSATGGGLGAVVSRTVTVGSANVLVDLKAGDAPWGSGFGTTPLCATSQTCDTVTLVDPGGRWHRWSATRPGAAVNVFYYGNPGDRPFTGDWNANGTATPGLYRQSDGYAYIRGTNTQGNADVTFFFGNPSDVPLAGDFNGNGRDTLSLFRPSEGRVYIINRLGQNGGGLGVADYSYYYGGPGDIPFTGDFNGNGTQTVGLYRPSNGWVYLRNSHTSGPANIAFPIGTGWTSVFAGDWNGDGTDTIAAYRNTTGTIFFAAANTAATSGYRLHVGTYPHAVRSAQG